MGASYELYSHEISAARSGLRDSAIEALDAGRRPNDLTDAESTAYDVTSVLLQGRQVPLDHRLRRSRRAVRGARHR